MWAGLSHQEAGLTVADFLRGENGAQLEIWETRKQTKAKKTGIPHREIAQQFKGEKYLYGIPRTVDCLLEQ